MTNPIVTEQFQIPIKAGNHDKLSMSWLPVSTKWRKFRKITAVKLLSTQSLDASQALRQAQVQQLLEYVQECCKIGKPIDIGRAAFTTSLSLLSNTYFTKELAHHSSSASQEFKQLMWCIMEEIGRPNYADYYPILGYIDPFGIPRLLTSHFDELIAVFQDIIRERLTKEQSCTSAATTDVLDSLLNLYKQKQLWMK
uniref:Cytochrome P450 n=1 Tax=Chenopodium quinoa TaxID=63459 RepID=A0A803MC51_CHEQI